MKAIGVKKFNSILFPDQIALIRREAHEQNVSENTIMRTKLDVANLVTIEGNKMFEQHLERLRIARKTLKFHTAKGANTDELARKSVDEMVASIQGMRDQGLSHSTVAKIAINQLVSSLIDKIISEGTPIHAPSAKTAVIPANSGVSAPVETPVANVAPPIARPRTRPESEPLTADQFASNLGVSVKTSSQKAAARNIFHNVRSHEWRLSHGVEDGSGVAAPPITLIS